MSSLENIDFFSLHLCNSIGNFVFYLHNSFTLLTLALGNADLMKTFFLFVYIIFLVCLWKVSVMMPAKSPTG